MKKTLTEQLLARLPKALQNRVAAVYEYRNPYANEYRLMVCMAVGYNCHGYNAVSCRTLEQAERIARDTKEGEGR